MSKYLEGGENFCPINSRYLESCLSLDDREVSIPRGLLRALVEIAERETDGITRRDLEPHRQMLLDYTIERIGQDEAITNLKFLAPYLKHDGQLRNALNSDVHVEAMALCDGYGNLSEDDLRERGLTWDWSHVRDSSPEALAAARDYIEAAVNFKG